MSTPFSPVPYPAFKADAYSLLGSDQKPVTLRTLVSAKKQSLGWSIFRERALVVCLRLRIVVRWIVAIIGVSGAVFAASACAAVILEMQVAGHNHGFFAFLGLVVCVAAIAARSTTRADGGSTFWKTRRSREALQRYALARAEASNRLGGYLEARGALKRLPATVRPTAENIVKLTIAHERHIDYYAHEIARTKRYVDLGHLTADQAAAMLKELRDVLDMRRAELIEAVSRCERKSIVAVCGGSADPEIARLSELADAAERHLHPSDGIDPRYPTGQRAE